MSYIALTYLDLALAAVLVVINGILSLALRLNLEKQLTIATVRMVAQLLLVGLVLKTLFALVSPLWTTLVAAVMVGFAAREVMARQHRRLSGFWAYGLGGASILVASTIVMIFALTTQIAAEPWYHPRYALPLLGMVLGNTMTGISLGLDTLTSNLVRDRAAVEARLMLGADRRTAMQTTVRGALRTGMMPTINAMSATGLVALPGMMTGQILAGADPVEAVKYQILVMCLIAGGTSLGTVGAVLAGAARLTDGRHRLRLDRLRQPES